MHIFFHRHERDGIPRFVRIVQNILITLSVWSNLSNTPIYIASQFNHIYGVKVDCLITWVDRVLSILDLVCVSLGHTKFYLLDWRLITS